MTKLRKQRKKKVFRASVNRKRLRNRLYSVGKIQSAELKKEWENRKSIRNNFKEMGLMYDPNENLKPSSIKQKLLKQIQPTSDWTTKTTEKKYVASKGYVAEALEKEAKAPRQKMFRLPNGQVEWITYLIDKYGEDYKAMVRDKRNYYQETWKQLRAKINLLKSIPEQYGKYLESIKSEISNNAE